MYQPNATWDDVAEYVDKHGWLDTVKELLQGASMAELEEVQEHIRHMIMMVEA